MFKDTSQILQDRHDKSHKIEKPSRYIIPSRDPQAAMGTPNLILRKNLKSQNADRRSWRPTNSRQPLLGSEPNLHLN